VYFHALADPSRHPRAVDRTMLGDDHRLTVFKDCHVGSHLRSSNEITEKRGSLLAKAQAIPRRIGEADQVNSKKVSARPLVPLNVAATLQGDEEIMHRTSGQGRLLHQFRQCKPGPRLGKQFQD
jgi:hypothetical protein